MHVIRTPQRIDYRVQFTARRFCNKCSMSESPHVTHHAGPRRLAESYVVRNFYSLQTSGFCWRTVSPGFGGSSRSSYFVTLLPSSTSRQLLAASLQSQYGVARTFDAIDVEHQEGNEDDSRYSATCYPMHGVSGDADFYGAGKHFVRQ